jgi:5-methylcytosine-specific restriction enzyme subunit McrC
LLEVFARLERVPLGARSRLAARPELARRCRTLAATLSCLGVSAETPSRAQLLGERFSLHDLDDRFMVAAAQLAFDIALPSESIGTVSMPQPDREKVWARKLFERAIGGFYAHVLGPHGWGVEQGKPLSWKIEARRVAFKDSFRR